MKATINRDVEEIILKKLFVIVLTVFAVIVTGCSQNQNDSANEPTEAVDTTATPEAAADTKASPTPENSAEETATPEGTIALKEQSVMSGLATIRIPEQFVIMSDDMKQIKYPTGNAPKEVFTNEEGNINVALSETGSPLKEEELEAFKDQMVATYQPIATEWMEDGIADINGKKAGYLSFVVTVEGDNASVYNYMVFTVVDDQLIIVSFNCLQEQLDEWKATGDEIIQSFKIA
ncbi:hypothetical protein [Paenibacillus sp. PL91]|uniref:hypothetical protein n=1 Tax=Paenibacillus sp. PL91 TaxID=2729538 RepID=UPI0016596D01|nr:hypothetical protein [Paenibacillus sp. PL91]